MSLPSGFAAVALCAGAAAVGCASAGERDADLVAVFERISLLAGLATLVANHCDEVEFSSERGDAAALNALQSLTETGWTREQIARLADSDPAPTRSETKDLLAEHGLDPLDRRRWCDIARREAGRDRGLGLFLSSARGES